MSKPKKSKKPATEIRMVTREVCEVHYFFVEVAKGASDDAILTACEDSNAIFGTPHNTNTKQCDVDVGDTVDRDYAKRFGGPIDLVKETQ